MNRQRYPEDPRRAKLCEAAQNAAEQLDALVPGNRVVVVVTDSSGDWVGVGSNTHYEDVVAVLRSALAGEDTRFHDTEPENEGAATPAVDARRLASDLFDVGATKRTRIMAALGIMDPNDDGSEPEVLRLQLARARALGKLSELRAMVDSIRRSSE